MLDGRYRFENFVVGGSNRVAASAARAVSEALGTVYNPLCIHGATGLGKTHLLFALGFAVRSLNPEHAVEYVTLDDFAEDWRAAVRSGRGEAFQQRFQALQVLLLDDVQQLSGRREAQSEILRMLDTLHQHGRQIVMAGDRPPSEIEGVDDGLRSRMCGGLLVDVGEPEYETRVGILKQLCTERDVSLSPGLIAQLAGAPARNVWELQATLETLSAPPVVTPLPARAIPPEAEEQDDEDYDADEVPPYELLKGVGADSLLADETDDASDALGVAEEDEEASGLAGLDDDDPSDGEAIAASGEHELLDAAALAPSVDAELEVATPDRREETTRPALAPPDEYQTFLSEIAAAVSDSVEQWRVRLGEAIARWSGDGFSTRSLERALDAAETPNLEGLEAGFVAAINRLRALEAEAARLDAKLAGLPVFRDPDRVAEAEGIVIRALAAYDPPPGPNRHLRIDAFVAGERNQLALRAAGDVIALPGSRCNPLSVHGPAGSGKTHLAHAIGNALAEHEGGAWTVVCVDAATLTEEIAAAQQEGSLDRWRLRYRAADALIVDDVEQLAGHERTQHELLNVVNLLRGAGKQIVFTADVSPAGLTALEPLLRARLEAGVIVEIGRVSESERVARHTPVPDGAEAAAPTIDAWFDESLEDSGAEEAPAFIASSGDVDSFFLDPEKVVTEWPAIDGRVLEELG